jgi:hypothetical protein
MSSCTCLLSNSCRAHTLESIRHRTAAAPALTMGWSASSIFLGRVGETMKVALFVAYVFCGVLAGGCTTDEVLRIRSLSTQSDPLNVNEVDGMVDGLKHLTEHANNTNIVFVHGIGWTQERGSKQFGDELLAALLRGYPGAIMRSDNYTCGTSTLDGRPQPQNGKRGLRIEMSAPPSLVSDDPNFSISVVELGCLDRTVIDLPKGKTITIYKFLWDDSMWGSAEWYHLGYDDPLPEIDGKKLGHAGYDDPDVLRAKLNSELKNSVVTYGLADAALYMSPVGKAMREGVQAAICTALNDSLESALANGRAAFSVDLCAVPPKAKAPLLLMSHSLGSRIVFDTVISDLSPTLAARIVEGTSNPTIEIHMFANQIPLVGIGRLGDSRTKQRIAGKSLRVVAYSEINDLLTYELVPYFEQLYYVRCYGEPRHSTCKLDQPNELAKRSIGFFGDLEARRQLVSDLGFDVVDVRLRFAGNKVAVYPGLKDPSIAHSGHMTSRSVLEILFCGVEKGRPRRQLSDCVGT